MTVEPELPIDPIDASEQDVVVDGERGPVLAVAGVSLAFGVGPDAVNALAEVSLEVQPGELVAVTGRSASGKSSLLNVAGGLIPVAVGSVMVQGEHLGGRSKTELAEIRRRHVGYVFQDLNLIPGLSAVENVSLPLELAGGRRRDAEAAAVEVLVRVGLGDHYRRFPDQLSGGQRQRVAIARGIVGSRSLILADEPTSALDEITGEEIMKLLRSECDRGAAALVVTHDPAQAAWADRVLRLQHGTIESETRRPAVRPDLSTLWS